MYYYRMSYMIFGWCLLSFVCFIVIKEIDFYVVLIDIVEIVLYDVVLVEFILLKNLYGGYVILLL